ncbi:MAG: DUF4091 domain-containing protein, partial [Acidobacteriaceae bacterium]|nr:DUF4091 domain-containing protein [Acidobacteriaceae bacterium]
PGEGMLVYPGKQVGEEGVVASMRLKWIRDGVEDYEYMQLLQELGRGDWAHEVAGRVGTDWMHWNHDPDVLEAVRRNLGQELDRLKGQQLRKSPAIP